MRSLLQKHTIYTCSLNNKHLCISSFFPKYCCLLDLSTPYFIALPFNVWYSGRNLFEMRKLMDYKFDVRIFLLFIPYKNK